MTEACVGALPGSGCATPVTIDTAVDPAPGTPQEPSRGEVRPQAPADQGVVAPPLGIVLSTLRAILAEVNSLRGELRDFARRERRDDLRVHEDLREIVDAMKSDPDSFVEQLEKLEAVTAEIEGAARPKETT